MGFLPSEIARLVLGYLEHENCRDAYNAFLNSSPNLSECRGRNFTHHLMGYSLVDILDEFGAIQILLKKCRSGPLRLKLRKCRNNIEKFAFLMEHATWLKPEDCQETASIEFEDKSTNTEIVCEDRSCQTDSLVEVPINHCVPNVKQCESNIGNVAQNGMLPVLPETNSVESEVDVDVSVEENAIFITNVRAESLENHFIEMLKPGTIVSTENISQVPIEVIFLDTANGSQTHEQNSLPAKEPCELTLERVQAITKEREIESDENEYSLDLYMSDSDSEMKLTSEIKFKFKCDICNKEFIKKQDLEDHIISTHDPNSQRNLSTSKDNRNNFETSNTKRAGEVYICDLCKKLFKKRYYLIEHIQYTHERNWKKCTKCDAEFSTRYQLYTHKKNVHKIINNVNELKCEQCNKTFTLKYLYRIHLNEVHAVNEERRFDCEHCLRMYPTQLKLRKHVRYMHTDIGEYRCEFCSKMYVSKVQLARHKQYSHSKDGSLVKCHHCRKTFGSVKQYSRHMREVHQNMTLKFVCQICSASFHIEKDLVNHCLDKHSESIIQAAKSNNVLQPMGNVLMKCSQCDKAFKCERQLKIHCKKSHEDGVKCKVCPKTFATNYRMQTHMTRSHSANGETFICVICTKVFETKYQLTAHTVMAHGEKKFCCQICSKAFSLKRSLTRHMNEVECRRGKIKKEVK